MTDTATPVKGDIRTQRWRTEGRFVLPAIVLLSLLVWGAGRVHWASAEPLWLVFAAFFAAAVTGYAVDFWYAGCARWQFHARVALKTGLVALCIYLTGWGPMLVVGLLYAVADTLENFGAKATFPALAWAVTTVALGQAAIALGIAPSMVREPVVDGLAVLASAGLVASGIYLRLATIRREEAQEELHKEQERFRALVQHSTDIILVLDAANIVTYASPSTASIASASPGAAGGDGLTGLPAASIVHPDDKAVAVAILDRVRTRPGHSTSGEIRVRHKDGSLHWVELIMTNLLASPGVGGIVVNGRDVTERKEFESELAERATHDPLTGLANRVLLRERLEHALKRLGRKPCSVAVLFCDLDRFKEVNDRLGHDAGDQLLVSMAATMQACLRTEDTLARLGGDEFAVLMETPDGITCQDASERAGIVAERLIATCQTPTLLRGEEVAVSASIGVVTCKAGQTPEEVLRQADLAMYLAKQNGRNRYERYGPDLDPLILSTLAPAPEEPAVEVLRNDAPLT